MAWPDHGVPDDAHAFIRFTQDVRNARAGSMEPLLVSNEVIIFRTLTNPPAGALFRGHRSHRCSNSHGDGNVPYRSQRARLPSRLDAYNA